MTVADVYSALTTPRTYRRDEQGQKKAFSLEEALKIMENMQPGHFDPLVISSFKKVVLSYPVLQRDAVNLLTCAIISVASLFLRIVS
jgi:HD-GYP domain-containing protein (c-di-GMP phosphodiesterase class II)